MGYTQMPRSYEYQTSLMTSNFRHILLFLILPFIFGASKSIKLTSSNGTDPECIINADVGSENQSPHQPNPDGPFLSGSVTHFSSDMQECNSVQFDASLEFTEQPTDNCSTSAALLPGQSYLLPVVLDSPLDTVESPLSDAFAELEPQLLPISRETSNSSDSVLELKKRKLEEMKELDDFEYFQGICTDGMHHKLPLDQEFLSLRDPSEYLGLAIRAHDAEAIEFCKNLVVLESASSYLQSSLIDAIVMEDADVLEALGSVFPSIFTTIYAFHPPYAHLSGTSLFRIAVDQEKSKSAKAMLDFIPVAMIGDFWQSIASMKKFIVEALHTGDINLTPKLEGDPGILPNILVEMYYTCVLEGDVDAMVYLLETTAVPIDTIFTGSNGIEISALFMAAHTGNREIVQYLYENCPALAKVPNSLGMLPIHMAAGNGHLEVIKILSKEADTLTSEVVISGIKYTPFSLAVRNQKRNVADLIISFLHDNSLIQKEMTGLAYWAILDDNVSLLDIYFEFNTFPSCGCVDKEYNLLEMAILGIIHPKNSASSAPSKKTSSGKCVDRLIDEWIKHKLPFRMDFKGVISGSILGLVYPHDIGTFESLINRAKVDPNDRIRITISSKHQNGAAKILETTFLNQIIALGATDLVPFAISKGCDPRMLDSDGNDAIAIALKYRNEFVLNYFRQVYNLADNLK